MNSHDLLSYAAMIYIVVACIFGLIRVVYLELQEKGAASGLMGDVIITSLLWLPLLLVHVLAHQKEDWK